MSANLETIIKDLGSIVGSEYVRSGKDDLLKYGTDWTKYSPPAPSLVVLPRNSTEIGKVLAYCNKEKIAVVPSGGRTGLAGGAIASHGEVVLSLERMNKIAPVDTVGLTIVAEAGATTQAVQEAAKNANLFFGLDLAAKGSCQIGGNIATNAGGTKLIRYGGMREQVLGIEVVLASGEILNLNSSLRKNNSGYDLKHLFIASEGTLGVVTKATLKLMPKPKDLQLTCMAVSDFAKIPKLLGLCNLSGLNLTAFEFFTKEALDIVLRYQTGLRSPFGAKSDFYVLIEIEGGAKEVEEFFEPLCEKAFEKDLITDAVISSSSAQFKELWGLRENISESISRHGQVRKNDISLPIDRLDEFVVEIGAVVAKAPKDIELILFGHIGDGNLHINYVGPKELDKDKFKQIARDVEKQIFSLLPKYQGSISAEHGIGLVKKADLGLCRSDSEVEFMRQIKRVFDPNGIMNPGKIFDL